MSVNRKWHRADVVISPVGCAVAALVISIVFILAALVWAR